MRGQGGGSRRRVSSDRGVVGMAIPQVSGRGRFAGSAFEVQGSALLSFHAVNGDASIYLQFAISSAFSVQ